MSNARRIVIIAGEESGDVHAAKLIRQLKARYPDCIISGIGGKHMQEAGADLIADLARLGLLALRKLYVTLKPFDRCI